MGNVYAAGPQEPSGGASLAPPPLVPPTPVLSHPSTDSGKANEEQANTNENNPGTFEELHRKCKGSNLNIFGEKTMIVLCNTILLIRIVTLA
jgi:hypothetical protein